MEEIFVSLYPLVAVIAFVGYMPQLKVILFAQCALGNISVTTWIIWASTWAISFGYGITKLHDVMFCVTAGMNLSVHFCIIAAVLYKRMVFVQAA